MVRRAFRPTTIGPSSPPSPLRVFISCSQEEFGSLRYELRDAINAEFMYNQKRTDEEHELVHQGAITQGFIVEVESDESFDLAMKRGIGSSQMYVGIFGKRSSEPTKKEYKAARRLGLPLLIYYFTKPPRKASSMHGDVVKFLDKEVKPFVRVGGNFRELVLHNEKDLVDRVLADIAARVTDLARESIATRRLILEHTPPELLAAILRSGKPIFE